MSTRKFASRGVAYVACDLWEGKVQEKYILTGKSLSEALIFESTNPQYDNR